MNHESRRRIAVSLSQPPDFSKEMTMTTVRKKARNRQEEERRRNSVAAIREFLKEPPIWTPEDVAELNGIIQEARRRSLTDFRSEGSERDLSPRNDRR